MIDSRTSSRSNKCAKWNSLNEKMSRKTSVLFLLLVLLPCSHFILQEVMAVCVCVCGDRFAQWEVYFFLNGWYDTSRGAIKHSDWLAWIKSSLYHKQWPSKSPRLGTRNIQNETTCGSCNSIFVFIDRCVQQKNSNHFIGAFRFSLRTDGHHCPSPFARITHTNLVIWFLIFHIFESIDWYGEMQLWLLLIDGSC